MTLGAAIGGGKNAWLSSEDTIYLVSLPAESNRSAILDLIERIYYSESLRAVSGARRVLRERIYANTSPTLTEREAVKVAAKRLSAPAERPVPSGTNVVRLPEAPALPNFEVPDLLRGTHLPRSEIAGELERLKRETTRAREKWSSDRAVSAILVDREGAVISIAWNTNAAIRTRHAEWNLCESLGSATPDGKIPAGATLYVSLKPCRMCAARIWESAVDPASLSVIYLENDPGPLAQGTMLEARSSARVRYLGPEHPLFAAEISRLGR
jgi:tRNA(Arg) A34 adenosine deaminase TadA